MMFSLRWCHFLSILMISAFSIAINRPVQKIVLNSKGYAQFIQYDIDVPPLREFTLCVWVRVTSLESDQSIFTYVGTDDKRIMRLWLDSGGRQLKVSLEHDRVTSSATVEFTAGAWRDVCVSYQADHGAWALYVDAKLLLCEGSQKFRNFQFPGKGRIIIGYGTSEKGFPTGLSGEIYGVSMILFSTIERDISLVPKRRNIQKNKYSPNENKEKNQYIVLGDLQSSEIQSAVPPSINKEHDFIFSDLSSPQHTTSTNKYLAQLSRNNKKEYDFSIDDKRTSDESDKKGNFNAGYKNVKFKVNHNLKKELTGSSTQDLPIVLEYETPPPITASTTDYSSKTSETFKTATENHHDDITLSNVEKPPPPDYDTKVYGQWTSSKYANNVLNFLKKNNFNVNKKHKKVMSSRPVGKLTDSYPYPSEFTYTIIRPAINYKRRKHRIERRHIIVRRENKQRQINLQIIRPSHSDVIFRLKHVDPKLVEVTNRGEAKRVIENTINKKAEDKKPVTEGSEEISNLENSIEKLHFDNIKATSHRHRGRNLMNIIPYLNSKDYFFHNRHTQTKGTKINQLLSNPSNQWPNIYQRTADVTHVNKSKPGSHKLIQASSGDSIVIGRALAMEVSNQAKKNIYNIPLIKYKHDPIASNSSNVAVVVPENYNNGKNKSIKSNFNKQVKLGNALNEQFISGFDINQIKDSFYGGDDAIPDIIRYQSRNIPASIDARVCEYVELYVHEDESIGKSKIKTPFQAKNLGIEFVMQSYKKCSTRDFSLRDSPLIIIDWTITPLKLFGGAYAKKTKDLCGFF